MQNLNLLLFPLAYEIHENLMKIKERKICKNFSSFDTNKQFNQKDNETIVHVIEEFVVLLQKPITKYSIDLFNIKPEIKRLEAQL